MYGEIEILRMVAELHHAELMAAAHRQRLLKCQQVSQPSIAALRSAFITWIGIQLVSLGCRLLADRQPRLVAQWHGMDKCLDC